MSSYAGDCFIVLNPHSEENSVIYGRNCTRPEGEVQEVLYFPSSEDGESVKCDGGAQVDGAPSLAVILSKSANVWGAESGANEKNVSIGISWTDSEPDEGSVKSTDLARLALQRGNTASEALDIITTLNENYGNESSKFSFVICDPTEAWILNLCGKLWAAEKISSGFRKLPSTGLAIRTQIDKSIDDLSDKLKEKGLWDGSGDLDFAKSFSSEPSDAEWNQDEPPSDGGFSLTDMFEVLRSTDTAGASQVSILKASGISCHWFTATPNPKESVFKPFAFAPDARISPLTKIPEGETSTLLHKLHDQRNWENVGELLKSLEARCVEEVKSFLTEHSTPNQELDELMKDCVEAEVKFYR